jgi:threonine synthase
MCQTLELEPQKPSDDKDLVAVTVTCASSGGTAAAAAAAAAPTDSNLGGEQ